MTTEIISIGSEILNGDIINTNAQWLCQSLSNLGFHVGYEISVGDDLDAILNAFQQAAKRSQIIIVTGGLGPTYDDLTKEALSAFCGKKRILHQETSNKLEAYFQAQQIQKTENNLKQAETLMGSETLLNSVGMACGIWVKHENSSFIILPGVPREMKTMFIEEVQPRLQSLSKEVLVTRTYRFYGIGESLLDDRLKHLMQDSKNLSLAPYASDGEVALRLRARAASKEACERKMESLHAYLLEEFKDYIYGIDIPDLQTAVAKASIRHKVTIATAESCTGGLIAKKLTDLSGASQYFIGSACTYTNAAKNKVLSISSSLLEQYGAVSKEVAEAMVLGAKNLFQSDYAISTTGIAGPSGGTEDKPVGLVYIGIATPNGVQHIRFQAQGMYSQSRDLVRELASKAALHALLRAIESIEVHSAVS